MKRPRTKGTKPLYVELPAELFDSLEALRAESGRSRTAEVALALRRHLAYPPPPEEVPPLDGKPRRRKQ